MLLPFCFLCGSAGDCSTVFPRSRVVQYTSRTSNAPTTPARVCVHGTFKGKDGNLSFRRRVAHDAVPSPQAFCVPGRPIPQYSTCFACAVWRTDPRRTNTHSWPCRRWYDIALSPNQRNMVDHCIRANYCGCKSTHRSRVNHRDQQCKLVRNRGQRILIVSTLTINAEDVLS